MANEQAVCGVATLTVFKLNPGLPLAAPSGSNSALLMSLSEGLRASLLDGEGGAGCVLLAHP